MVIASRSSPPADLEYLVCEKEEDCHAVGNRLELGVQLMANDVVAIGTVHAYPSSRRTTHFLALVALRISQARYREAGSHCIGPRCTS